MSQMISTTAAPAAIGPYSQAIRVGDLLFLSGQLGLEPASGQLRDGVEAQAEQAMDNIGAVLAEAGAGFAQVVKKTIFLADMADFQTVNRIYGARFGACPPARSTVQVAGLPKGGRVEIEAVAYLGS